jgi:predicted house-cleaning noncanonical NTP pyrophosphatase (MazG superfamily)
MEKISYNKLIRDRIPEIMAVKGKGFEVQSLSSDVDFEASLFQKLSEEAAEVCSAQGRDELMKELADLAEVVKTLCELKRIPFWEVEKLQAERRRERGGFEKRLLLLWGEKD